jgi:5-hydroxyisourate hydrolase
MGRLSTHVLDTTQGKPAQGVLIDVHRIDDGGSAVLLKQVTTNREGRTDQPILADEQLKPGIYILTFHVADYFKRNGLPAEASFLDLVPVRFSIIDSKATYHVPLLLTPWSYSTYRGS